MSDISRLPMSDIGWWWFGLPAALRTAQQKLGAMALEMRSPTARSLETKEQLTLVLEDSLAKYRCFRNCATVVCGRAMSAWLDSCAFALRNLIQDVVGVSYCQITQLAWKIRISTKNLPLKSQETKLRQSSGRIVICCRRCWISERRLSRWNVSHPSGRTDSRRKFTPSASALAANMGA